MWVWVCGCVGVWVCGVMVWDEGGSKAGSTVRNYGTVRIFLG